jgi:hypothetical protein
MVRVVRTPEVFRDHFSWEQLSGWPPNVAYVPYALKRRRKKKAKPEPPAPTPAPPAKKVTGGVALKIV